MRIFYSDETQRHEVNGKGSMILSKNEYGLKIDHLKNFNFNDLTIVGQWGKFGKIKQLYDAFKFIYGLGKYK